MVNLVLEKEWSWRKDADIYDEGHRPTRTDYPFWWYSVIGNEIELRKQVSRTFGIIFDSNKLVIEDTRTSAEKLNKKNSFYEIDSETASELERRSWMSLGEPEEVEKAPLEYTISHPSGGGAVYKFHPVTGKLWQTTWINSDGEITYKAMFEYNDKHFAVKYGNTLGDRWARVWDKEKSKYLWKQW